MWSSDSDSINPETMKKASKYVLTCLFCSLALSCSEDFLTTSPTSALTEASYFKNVDELQAALYACYASLNSYQRMDNWLSHIATGLFILGNIGSDDSEKGSFEDDLPEVEPISLSRQRADNEIVKVWWDINFDLIAKCNTVIGKSEEVEGDAAEIERIVDQAKCLRAFGFYNLVTLFGDIPMPTQFLNPEELSLERTPESEVWELIEQDLNDAKNLPLKSESQFGLVDQGFVYAMLGKAFMWQQKFDQAIEAYSTLVASGEYQLVDDYGLIHRYEGENCAESIFEFQNEILEGDKNVPSTIGVFRMPRDEWNGFGFDIPTQDLLDEFELGDPRIIYTFNFIGDVFPSPEGEYVVANNESRTGYSCRKAWIPYSERTDNFFFQTFNWRYCRYAEVLLFYAEALNETGQPDQARMYLNMIRERARNTPTTDPQRISCSWDLSHSGELLPDVTTSDQTLLREAIYHEQRVELGTEGHRRWILLRTGQFKEAMERAKGSIGCSVEDHEWLLPIPLWDVDFSEGAIEQNPGYN
jgi:tetratricopeptide (TPR) repeat protein